MYARLETTHVSNIFVLNNGRALRVVVSFLALCISTCTSTDAAASKKLPVQSSGTLPASFVSNAPFRSHLLMSTKFLTICHSLLQYNAMGICFVGLYLQPCSGHCHKSGAKMKPRYDRTGIATF